jgi:hypothetical protein
LRAAASQAGADKNNNSLTLTRHGMERAAGRENGGAAHFIRVFGKRSEEK